MDTTVINVEGMTCNHCKMSVEKALTNLAGVNKAEVNLAAKNVTVTFEPGKVDITAMKNAITRAGYEVE
ncbi:hypothetical protein SY88_09470 [Clostridiales bacterium PH28_bin88]|nr:hypothetical protein SY88_09470 [Clostridiales bacterium PH28_bin88]